MAAPDASGERRPPSLAGRSRLVFAADRVRTPCVEMTAVEQAELMDEAAGSLYAAGSKRNYDSHGGAFVEFCQRHRYPTFPVQADVLGLYYAYYVLRKPHAWSPGVAQTHSTKSLGNVWAALKAWQEVELSIPWSVTPDQAKRLNRLKASLASQAPSRNFSRLPCRAETLLGVFDAWEAKGWTAETLVLQALLATAYDALLRVGEYIEGFLTPADVNFVRDVGGTLIGYELTIRNGKTRAPGDPTTGGLQTASASTGGRINSAVILHDHMAREGLFEPSRAREPLFQRSVGGRRVSFTREAVNSGLQQGLEDAGLNRERMSSHSLRKGKAFDLNAARVPLTNIMRLGRWASLACLDYIGLGSDVIADVSRMLREHDADVAPKGTVPPSATGERLAGGGPEPGSSGRAARCSPAPKRRAKAAEAAPVAKAARLSRAGRPLVSYHK